MKHLIARNGSLLLIGEETAEYSNSRKKWSCRNLELLNLGVNHVLVTSIEIRLHDPTDAANLAVKFPVFQIINPGTVQPVYDATDPIAQIQGSSVESRGSFARIIDSHNEGATLRLTVTVYSPDQEAPLTLSIPYRYELNGKVYMMVLARDTLLPV